MKITLLYLLALFVSPFLSGGISFVLMMIFSPLSDQLKKKGSKSFDVLAGFESTISVFLTITILVYVLGLFEVQISWLFIGLFITYFLVNDVRRVLATKFELLEITQSIGNIIGTILAGIYYLF